ncbi:MAG: tetratricopeptide repeat protein [Bacteroidota bacterium]
MAKVIKYIPENSDRKLGLRKENKTKADKLEDQGQLNMFRDNEEEEQTPILHITSRLDNFNSALNDDNEDTAILAYQRSIDQGVMIDDCFCNLGILYASKGQSAKAISSFNQCLAKNPSHMEGHYNLANMYFDLKNYELATIHYELALEANSDFTEIYYNIALSFYSLQNYNKALDHLASYCNAVPSDQNAKSLLRRIRILASTQK